MGTLFVDKLDPQSGTSLEIGSSGDTITIPSGCTITNNGTQTGFGGTNTPYFRAYANANFNLGNNVRTTIPYNQETFDSANAYDTSTYRFTPQTAGYYHFTATLKTNEHVDVENFVIYIRKNGTEIMEVNNGQVYFTSVIGSCIVHLNGSSDYVDVAGNQNRGSDLEINGLDKKVYFQGFKLIT